MSAQWAWLAIDGDRPWGIGATQDDAQQMLDELLADLPSATVTEGWYEPALPTYQDGTRFMRWYNHPPQRRDVCQEVRRYPLQTTPTPTEGATP